MMKKIIAFLLLLSLLFLNSCTDSGVIENWWNEKPGEKTQAELIAEVFANQREQIEENIDLESQGKTVTDVADCDGFWEAVVNGSHPALNDIPCYDVGPLLFAIDFSGFHDWKLYGDVSTELSCYSHLQMPFVQIVDNDHVVAVYRLQDDVGRRGWLYVEFARQKYDGDKKAELWERGEVLFFGKTLSKSDLEWIHTGDSFQKLVGLDSTFGMYMIHHDLRNDLKYKPTDMLKVKWPLSDCNMILELDVSAYTQASEVFESIRIESIAFEDKNPEETPLDRLEMPYFDS